MMAPRFKRRKHGLRSDSADLDTGWGMDGPSIYHALVIIFLEFFAWGLLTNPMIKVLKETFPDHTFLFNGLIYGVKGILSFFGAPLVGALSDEFGRKPFLLITVATTCAPIPFLKFSSMWFYAMLSLSGLFAVTFSVVFAYVADITDEEDRSSAYGLVSATFAASLVTSPAIGAYLEFTYGEYMVVLVAVAAAVLDFVFILLFVPESLQEKENVKPPSLWGSSFAWEKADPFSSLWKIGKDQVILLLCVAVFLSYLPEAGQYSSLFVYLKLVIGFSETEVAGFIALVGVLSVAAQTLLLTYLMKTFGHKVAIVIGLAFEMMQMIIFGFGSEALMMYVAGCIAAVSSITYPAISAFVSAHVDADQQGVAQGVMTGMRGLCSGLGPALFGLIFYTFNVDLYDEKDASGQISKTSGMPGPPFAFGAVLVFMALTVAIYLPGNPHPSQKHASGRKSPSMGAIQDGSVKKTHEKERLSSLTSDATV